MASKKPAEGAQAASGSKPTSPTSAARETQPAASQVRELAGPDRDAAAEAAVASNSTVLHLPLLGRVVLPSQEHLAWYAGVGALAAVELIDWPVALVLVVGKMLADNRSNAALRDFGRALEEA